MRAVNLIPSDARRSGKRATGKPQGPAYAILGMLALALVLVTVYVLTNNTISERQAKVTSLQAQVAQVQAQAGRLSNYAQFAKLAQARADTVREIAAARFDWHGALADLSKVVPADTSLQSLAGSVAPGAGAGGTTAAGSGSLRGDISAPAFELTGCTKTQDDVARLMSRLRLINGVTRVTLGDSAKPGSAQSGGTAGSPSGGGGCGLNAPVFDLVVFFTPLPAAGPTGVASVTAVPVSSTTATTATTATTTPGGSK